MTGRRPPFLLPGPFQVALEEDNALQSKSLVLQMGVGLHVGEVVVGTIGSEARAKYGIVGSAVNLTHRIQGQAKGGEVVISEPTLQKAGPGLAVQKTFETHLKGIQEAGVFIRGRGHRGNLIIFDGNLVSDGGYYLIGCWRVSPQLIATGRWKKKCIDSRLLAKLLRLLTRQEKFQI